jgi:DNA-binding LacI/PurR family transcriptional regulator
VIAVGGYGEAAAKALPHAVQVADRWHLMENASRAFLDAVGESRAATRKLLSGPKVPTAIICGNDVIAFGAVLECIALGINVPKEISITGVDDLELATYLNPPLTTIRVPSVEMGQSAGNFHLAKFTGRNCPDHHLLPLELIVRSSTGVPRMESLLRRSASTRAERAGR